MNNNGYGKYLSNTYDLLNSDVDYKSFADFYEQCFDKYSDVPITHVCEMACGTGNMSIELQKKGYCVTAFDISEEMLTIADKKARDYGIDDIRFTIQNMQNFKVYSKAQGVICMMDSVNCLDSSSALYETFKCVNDALDKGGVFIFDVNTKHKFENVYSDNAYVLEEEGVLLAWQNFYNASSKKCDLFLTFFFEDDNGRYTRVDEHIKQKMHTDRVLSKLLKETGFEIKAKVSDFDFEEADEKKCDRMFYICKKV